MQPATVLESHGHEAAVGGRGAPVDPALDEGAGGNVGTIDALGERAAARRDVVDPPPRPGVQQLAHRLVDRVAHFVSARVAPAQRPALERERCLPGAVAVLAIGEDDAIAGDLIRARAALPAGPGAPAPVVAAVLHADR